MFNLKKHSWNNNELSDSDLLQIELVNYHIKRQSNGHYNFAIGDEVIDCDSIAQCSEHLQHGIEEIKDHLWNKWHHLAEIADSIIDQDGQNEGSVDNILFLNSVKKSYFLSRLFDDLSEVTNVLKLVFDVDIANVDPALISEFNVTYLQIRIMHRLVISELYRGKLIKKYMEITKEAQISGPWANLDLPMGERIWPWAEDAEYFGQREKARKEQIRYNPEYIDKTGFFFVWQDKNRDPYKFEDMKEEQPYKSRHILQIA